MEPCIETIPMGASIYRFLVPSKDSSEPFNIVLSFPHPDVFASHPHPHFSNTIGRTTNRISNARLENLNGKTYHLAKNNGDNNLHGGNKGWGKHTWDGPHQVERGCWDSGITGLSSGSTTGERKGLLYTLESPDGNEGFPGDVEARVWYFEGRGSKGEIVLDVEYEASLSDATGKNQSIKETVIGMTNHAYFNLNPPSSSVPSEASFLSHHTATLSTSTHLPLSSSNPGIPTGELSPHPAVPKEPRTPFYLTSPTDASSSSPDSLVTIDDCFILPPYSPQGIPIDTRSLPLRELATLRGDISKINLRVESTEPAFQFYTGAWIDVPAWAKGKGADGKEYDGGVGYGPGAGVCVEPSRWVDCVSRDEWRGMGLLKKGEVFGARIRYVAWTE